MGRRTVWLVGALIALQLLVPTIALIAPGKPNRLGWQMYSGLGDKQVEVTDAIGNALEVPWGEALAKSRRPELDWLDVLPEHLCSVLEEPVITVQVGPDSRTVEC